jgi:hypothetical protein
MPCTRPPITATPRTESNSKTSRRPEDRQMKFDDETTDVLIGGHLSKERRPRRLRGRPGQRRLPARRCHRQQGPPGQPVRGADRPHGPQECGGPGRRRPVRTAGWLQPGWRFRHGISGGSCSDRPGSSRDPVPVGAVGRGRRHGTALEPRQGRAQERPRNGPRVARRRAACARRRPLPAIRWANTACRPVSLDPCQLRPQRSEFRRRRAAAAGAECAADSPDGGLAGYKPEPGRHSMLSR